MFYQLLKSKIHRAVVTQTDLHYEGSITIDAALMEAAGLYEYEKVHVFNIENGTRAETYVIRGEPQKGEIIMNGALARLAHRGDRVIILSFTWLSETEMKEHLPTIVWVDDHNRVIRIEKSR